MQLLFFILVLYVQVFKMCFDLSRKQGYICNKILHKLSPQHLLWQKPIYQQVRHYCSILTSPMPSTYLVSIPSSCQCQSTSSGDSQSRICVCGCPAYSYHRSCRQIPRITKRRTVLLEWTLSCLWYMYKEYQYSRTCLARHLCKPMHCVIWPPCLF